jgi:DNA-binding Lrp family transcriptional regulator
MSVGSYVLMQFTDSEKLLPAIAGIDQCKEVVRWNAVDGHVQLIVKLKSDSSEMPEEIKELIGIEEMMSYFIQTDGENGTKLDHSLSHAYVFIETEAGKRDAVITSLKQIDAVVFSSQLTGGCDIVAVVKGNDFESVDKLINGRIRMIDGVARLKKNRVIELAGM